MKVAALNGTETDQKTAKVRKSSLNYLDTGVRPHSVMILERSCISNKQEFVKEPTGKCYKPRNIIKTIKICINIM